MPWFPSLFFFFEQTVSLPDDSAARQHSRALLSSEPLSARVVDELERLPVLVERVTCLLIRAVACGRAPSRALVPREPSTRAFFVSGRLERLQLLSQRICLALRIVALRRMRRRLAKQVSPARQGHDDLALRSASLLQLRHDRCSCVDAPSGQLRGGGSSKILQLNSGGDSVQNQFSSRAVESALPFAMALSFKEGTGFAGQVRPREATTLALVFSG